MNDQTNINKLKEINMSPSEKRIEEDRKWKERQDERIEDLEDDIRMIKEYSIDGLKDSLRDLEYNVDVKLERIEEILVVHRNQDRAQKKNYKALRDVWDKTVMKIIEKGEHGEHK